MKRRILVCLFLGSLLLTACGAPVTAGELPQGASTAAGNLPQGETTAPAPGAPQATSPAPPVQGPQVITPIAVGTLADLPQASPPHKEGTMPPREMPAPGPLPGRLPPPYPQPGDAHLREGPAFVEQATLTEREGELVLRLRGALPTPCHELRVAIAPPDAHNQVKVRVYSVVDPNRMCVQVLAPFEQEVSLHLAASGGYTVLVNDQAVPFDANPRE